MFTEIANLPSCLINFQESTPFNFGHRYINFINTDKYSFTLNFPYVRENIWSVTDSLNFRADA